MVGQLRKMLACLLALCACHDAADDALAHARSRYQELAQAGTPAQSHEFEAVLRELRTVPPSSHAGPEAAKLVRAIEAARTMAPRRPLAVGATPLPDLGAPELQRRLEGARIDCERLAQELGTLSGDTRQQKLVELDGCRRRVEALSEQIEHSEGESDGGAR
jgi:hypothetical protein